MDATQSTPSADRHAAEWWALLNRDWQDPGNLDATLTRIAETAKEVFEADLCVIFALNPVTRRFVPKPGVAGELEGEDGTSALKPPRKKGLVQWVMQKGFHFAENISALPEDQATFSRSQKICCFAAVALHTQRHDRPFAVLYVDYRQPRSLGLVDRENLLRFAELASHKLQATWFLRRYQRIGQIGQQINQGIKTQEELFRELCDHVGRIIDIDHYFLLAVHNHVGNELDLFTRIDRCRRVERRRVCGPQLLHLLQGAEPILIKSREGVPTEKLGVVESLSGSLPWQPASFLVVPLLLAGRLLGTLSVQHPDAHAYDDEDRHLLALLGNHVALALSNQQLFGHLDRLHKVGRTLVQNLESRNVLGSVVAAIRDTTGCDLAVLYPYVQTTGSFECPPTCRGRLQQEEFPQPLRLEPGGVAYFVVRQRDPVFEEDARQLLSRIESSGGVRTGSFQEREAIRSVAALPLRVGEEAVGALFVNYRTPQSFGSDPAQQQMIEGLASYAAIAIKNARTFGAEQSRHLKNLETLRNLDREISRCADLDSLLQTTLVFVAKRLADEDKEPDEASILIYDEQQEALVTRAAIGAHRERSLKQILREDDNVGITLEALRTKSPLLVGDVLASEWRDRYLDVGGETRCELDVPLLDGEAVLGILNLESRQPDAFHPSDLEIIKTLAGQAVLAVRKAQAHEDERRLREDEETLIELGKELTRSLDVKELFKLIVQRAIENTNADAGVLVLINPQHRDLIVKAEQGVWGVELGRRLSREEGILGWVARKGSMVNADLTESFWKKLHIPAVAGMQSELAVPLKQGDETIGVLNVESSKRRFFNFRNERLLSGLADLAIIALQNAERFEAADKRQRKLKALDELGRKVVAQLEAPDQVMKAVVRHALELTDATTSDLDLYEDGRRVTAYRAQKDIDTPETWGDLRIPGEKGPPRGIMHYVGETRKSLLIEGDAEKDARYQGPAGIHSELAVPLEDRKGELLGVLDVTSTEFNAFDDEDLELLELFAAQAVIAIENSRNYKAAEQRLRRFELLLRAGQDLAQITDLEDLENAYEIVVRMAEEQCQSEVVVRRFEPATRDLVRVGSVRTEGPGLFLRIPWDDPLNGRAARERRTLVVDDAENPPPDIGKFERSNPEDMAFVVTPICFEDAYYGNLALSHQKPRHFRPADVKLIAGLAQQLAITIHRLEEVEAHQTAEKRAQEAEAMGEIGRQTYEIMHRLGNDLGLVPKWVRKVRSNSTIKDPAIEPLFGKILEKVNTVLGFSKNLGDELSKQISSKREPPKVAPTSVRLLFDDAVAGLQTDNEDAIEVEISIPNDVGTVLVDHNQMVGALLNLLTNSRQAMPAGGKLLLKADRVDDKVALQVQDTGPGIEKEDRQKIFDLGFTTKSTGTGFGLWSTKQIIATNGGKISVESESNRGTTFTIVLPRTEESRHD